MRSEEVIIKQNAQGHFVHGCHGNAEIHMHTKFHLLRSEQVDIQKSARGHFLFMVIMEMLKCTVLLFLHCT